jgi:hypothetical protein
MEKHKELIDIKLPWKDFKIHLKSLNSHLISVAGSDYCGLSATDECICFHFKNKPSNEIVNRIREKLNSLTPEIESEKFKKDSDIEKSIKSAKINLPYSDPKDMSTAERKLMMGIHLSNEDKEFLLSKYPQ